jgi:hypothetical protein
MDEIREKIARLIEGSCFEGDDGEIWGAGNAADAILNLPEIKEALRERNSSLGVATKLGRL